MVVVISVNFRSTLLNVFGIRCGMRSVFLYFSALQVFFLEPRCVFMWTDVVYVKCEKKNYSIEFYICGTVHLNSYMRYI